MGLHGFAEDIGYDRIYVVQLHTEKSTPVQPDYIGTELISNILSPICRRCLLVRAYIDVLQRKGEPNTLPPSQLMNSTN